MEGHLSVINMVRELAGDTILVAMGIDATYAIPEGPGFEEFLMSFYDFPEERKQEAEKRTTWAIEIMKRMLDAGAEVMYMCSDYCFNDGPFLSPAMFEEFIYPYLEKQTRALKQAGAYVIKHTDGNILPIADMLLDSGPHAIQSLDPIAGIDIAEMKRICRGKAALMGNVNTASLQTGPPERIEESARYALTHGMPGGGYIFSSCNSIFDGIPLEHYNLMLEVREQNGYYPESERRSPL
jgi:uroporphyrinogen decarboxylase